MLTVPAKVNAELLEAPHCQIVLRRQLDNAIAKPLQVFDDSLDTLDILRILFVIGLVTPAHDLVSSSIHLVRALDERLQSAKDEALAQALWIERQVSDGTETAEALTDGTPLLLLRRVVCSKSLSDGLAITDDVISAIKLEILCLHVIVPSKTKSSRGHRCAQSSTSLVKVEHLISPIQESLGEWEHVW